MALRLRLEREKPKKGCRSSGNPGSGWVLEDLVDAVAASTRRIASRGGPACCRIPARVSEHQNRPGHRARHGGQHHGLIRSLALAGPRRDTHLIFIEALRIRDDAAPTAGWVFALGSGQS